MLKKALIVAIAVATCAPAWAQSGQLGANQIWGNPTGASAPSKPSNIGSFLTQGTGLTIGGTPKATIGITNTITAAGPSGSATQTPVITYNAQGQLTLVTLATIAPPFTAITGSLACSQQPAFTGDTTSPSGSCVNTTVKVNGVAFGTSPSTDTVPVITAANTATYTALPNCTAGILQYATAGHLFSCGVAGTGTVTSATIAAGVGISVTGTCAITTSGTCTVAVNQSVVANSLGADQALGTVGTFTDGPSVAQGTSGTWWASGTVTLLDTAATASFGCKLWDGTTVISSAQANSVAANALVAIALSGFLTTPAANIKITCKDVSAGTGKFVFNSSGASKDSTLSVHRVQ